MIEPNEIDGLLGSRYLAVVFGPYFFINDVQFPALFEEQMFPPKSQPSFFNENLSEGIQYDLLYVT